MKKECKERRLMGEEGYRVEIIILDESSKMVTLLKVDI